MASSGGVGAVRRARRLNGRARALSLIAVLGLVASGHGSSAPGFTASLGSQLLAGLRLEPRGDAPAADSSAALELAAAPVDAAAAATEIVAENSVVTVPPAPPTSAAVVDRPIVAPPVFPRARAAASRSNRTNYSAGPKDGGVWAVVVGIDDYPGDDADLRAAVADAKDVDSALAAYGVPANHRLMLLDKQATADNIRGALAWMAARAAVDSTAVFFYSGHVRQVAGDPDRDGEVIDEAIVAADGDNVFDGHIADMLRGIEARSAWLGIAACYGAGFDDALAPGRILTAAAGENDVAYENSSLGHSYMVEYMVRRAMLQGKAPASVQDAFAWARAQIARDYPNRQPAMLDRSRGPVVLGRATTPSPSAPERKPAASPPPESKEPQPAPSGPPPTTPEPSNPGGSACAEVLGVSVCSEQRSRGPHLWIGPARPVEQLD
ncbi:MAG TPA: caspase family protein [Acidimicrobiia bacterium]|nr:caspase family protein [Acidimicrobiia bacterium]